MQTSEIADGYVLEFPGDSEDTILSRIDFLVMKKRLVQTKTWEQVVGALIFGGSTWVLNQNIGD